ncbi:uncharacterized protein LOC128263974 isoform X3 [Drosophila gunungcola]|uniref:uncharacterized protein LOC128263974 isoform X3 n=1 Tax=Drosophila gunungcola TaxID=103775 RepID=UPI0022E4FDB5|nr:uncharacterized protein LOC128263974 isoform X3 [Drosophila gunungcola]XP_052855217.1 uncharacterized protein LOC128263974 isoform X3 [Drosophila gunungcola]XP_052855218.1 uncharacterized protein LOC128263974 isoform X3 [Drosophila gunungcola]
MVDEQLSGALRDLPGRVLNVPVEERELVFRNVSSVLRNPVVLLGTEKCGRPSSSELSTSPLICLQIKVMQTSFCGWSFSLGEIN